MVIVSGSLFNQAQTINMQKLKDIQFIHLSEDVMKTLIQNRILTVLEFLQEDVTKLSAITKLNLSKILDTRNEIFQRYCSPVINGSEVLKICLKKQKYQRTGLASLDSILQGGLPKGHITELCGLAGCGKTQLCFQITVNCAKNSDCVLYIDTKGDFSSTRIQKILDSSNYSHKEMALIMYRIKVIRIWSIEELSQLLKKIKNKTIDIENLSMIIIDSLPCLMFEFLGDNNKIGLSMLNTMVNYIRYLSKEMGLCVICVNIQTRWVDQEVGDLEDDGEPPLKDTYAEKRNRCLGRYWQHIPYLVLLLQHSEVDHSEQNNKNVLLSVMKSINLDIQSKECILTINSLGIN